MSIEKVYSIAMNPEIYLELLYEASLFTFHFVSALQTVIIMSIQ